jgi:8-oxo-dGTP pyrophosphatase MutT (NUDIX family)
MTSDALLYVGQKAFINKNGNLLVLIDPIYGNDFPGGKVQEGETNFAKALQREVYEETGLKIEVLEPFNTWYFEWPKGHRNYGKKAIVIDYKCKYILGEVKTSKEHEKKYIWINKDSFLNYFKEGDLFYDSLKRYFSNLIQNV